MRFLLWVLAIFSLLWGGYWFVGSRTVEKTAVTAIEDANLSGYDISYSNLNTTGFPNRFDTTIKDINVRTPANVHWSAPFFQVFALSYKPYHLIAVWPHDQSFTVEDQQFAVNSTDLRASLVVEPNATTVLDRFQLTGTDLSISLDGNDPLTIRNLSIATRQGGTTFSHDLSISAEKISVPTSQMDTRIDSVTLDANLGFDGPIGHVGKQPVLTNMSINKASISQNSARASVTGELTFDSAGFASGSLLVTAENWEAGFQTLQELNAFPLEHIDTVHGVLAGLANANGSATEIQAPLTVKRGQILLGFVPLGFIPPF